MIKKAKICVLELFHIFAAQSVDVVDNQSYVLSLLKRQLHQTSHQGEQIPKFLLLKLWSLIFEINVVYLSFGRDSLTFANFFLLLSLCFGSQIVDLLL